MSDSVKKKKRGPDPERLKIENPEEALRKLLTPPPAKSSSDQGEEHDEDDGAHSSS